MAKTTATVGVIEQLRVATGNLPALIVGGILGGFPPTASYVLAHVEQATPWSLKGLLILGCLGFSSKSVYQWCKRAFADVTKSVGFVLALEGVMLVSETHWLTGGALALLIGINAIANGTNLALQDLPKVEKKLPRVKLSGVTANDNSGRRPARKSA